MFPTQVNSAIQTDVFPTQNIGLIEHKQPQIYSLLADANTPSPTKKRRRKKTTKLDETIPVTINPQITRAHMGAAFDAPHYRSTIIPDSIASSISTRLSSGHSLPLRLFIDSNSYDANNNINHSRVPSPSASLNSSSQTQAQKISAWHNETLSVANANLMPQIGTRTQPFRMNQLLNNNTGERIVAVSSPHQNEYKHLNSNFTLTDQGSLLGPSYSVPTLAASVSTSAVPQKKPKRRYTKRLQASAPLEQQQQAQQISQSHNTFTQPTVTNCLPNIIPSSVTVTPIKSVEQPFQRDTSIPSNNFVPLTPPASISSIKSPPTTINNESALVSMQQQHLLSQTTTNITEVNSVSKQNCHDQGFSHTQKIINDSSANQSPFNIHRFLATAQSPYYTCMFPSSLMHTNLLPMARSSILPGTIPITSLGSIPTEMKKEKKKREKSVRKPKVIQSPIAQVEAGKQLVSSKTLTKDISAVKKRKRKNSNMKDSRTKRQLRRITRRNQMAVLKFMIRKRRLQKQERISVPTIPDVKAEQVVPKLSSTHMAKEENMETNLPDIIAPSLKITFDVTQRIESIILYYHRRRKPDFNTENSPNSSINADNKLGLLIEAVEFIETLHGSSKLALPSGK